MVINILSFIVGTSLGFIGCGLLTGAVIADRESEAYLSGYNDGIKGEK